MVTLANRICLWFWGQNKLPVRVSSVTLKGPPAASSKNVPVLLFIIYEPAQEPADMARPGAKHTQLLLEHRAKTGGT